MVVEAAQVAVEMTAAVGAASSDFEAAETAAAAAGIAAETDPDPGVEHQSSAQTDDRAVEMAAALAVETAVEGNAVHSLAQLFAAWLGIAPHGGQADPQHAPQPGGLVEPFLGPQLVHVESIQDQGPIGC